MADEQFGPEPPLARLLLLASRWFDSRLLDQLERSGWPRLSPSQSLLFAYLEDGGVAQAELARRVGHTRQATHELVHGLCRIGLLELCPDPRRKGGRLVCLTDAGRRFAVDAYGVLMKLEEGLGAERVATLRRLLAPFDEPTEPTPARAEGD
jgi:DNA-binding MarR family transcriptional regulator